jgi:hypothetical protein
VLNITVMSYQGSVDIGVIGDRNSVHDVEQIAGGFVRAVADLLATVDPPPASAAGRPAPHRTTSGRPRRSRSSAKATPPG